MGKKGIKGTPTGREQIKGTPTENRLKGHPLAENLWKTQWGKSERSKF